jgi:hypothetical protein
MCERSILFHERQKFINRRHIFIYDKEYKLKVKFSKKYFLVADCFLLHKIYNLADYLQNALPYENPKYEEFFNCAVAL